MSSRSPNPSGSISSAGQDLIKMDRAVLQLQMDRELEEITLKIMQIPLQGPGGYVARWFKTNYSNSHGLIGKHDYIMLEYGTPGSWIKAEKVGESRHGGKITAAGIHLSLQTTPAEGEIRHQVTIKGPGPGVKWTMAQVIQIMGDHDSNYDLMSGNCWKYAFYCAKAILEWCIANAKDENVRNELEQELEKLKPVERPEPGAVLQWLLHPKRPENAETGAKLKQKLDLTVINLEEANPKSQRAKVLSRVRDKVADHNVKYRPANLEQTTAYSGRFDERPRSSPSPSLHRPGDYVPGSEGVEGRRREPLDRAL